MPDATKAARRRGTHPRSDRARGRVARDRRRPRRACRSATSPSALDMSKSGVYAHFGSKQDLQLATVDEAERIFRAEVIEPALAAAPGLAQLVALCDAFFDHLAAPHVSRRLLLRRRRPGDGHPARARSRNRSPRSRAGSRALIRQFVVTALERARAARRRGPRRAHLRAQRHHPRRQRQLRPARRIPPRSTWPRTSSADGWR